jgi:hypothetical protein
MTDNNENAGNTCKDKVDNGLQKRRIRQELFAKFGLKFF